MTGMRLSKHHGLGNDFLVVMADHVPEDAPDLARRLCHRTEGVGADGLIVVTPGTDPSRVGFNLFNSDGSQAEVSGNGLRCLGQALDRAREQMELDVVAETLVGPRRVRVHPTDDPLVVEASVEMGRIGAGVDLPADLVEDLDGLVGAGRVASADVGNPHVVIEVADPDAVDLDRLGPAVEARLGPINVEVVRLLTPERIELRVWERGAGVTQACGSGACAAVFVARRWGAVGDRVEVVMPGGPATVALQGDDAVLTGPSTYVATIEVHHG